MTNPTDKRDKALASAFAEHGRKLIGQIRRQIRDQAEAEDIAQDVFIEYVESYDLETAIDSIGAWLYSVARNKILDRFRRKKHESNYRAQQSDSTEDSQLSQSRPDEEWNNAVLRDEITKALESLPVEQRTVFIQHELQGLSYEEIAAESGVNVNTLLSRKRYAVQALREHLKEFLDASESRPSI